VHLKQLRHCTLCCLLKISQMSLACAEAAGKIKSENGKLGGWEAGKLKSELEAPGGVAGESGHPDGSRLVEMIPCGIH